ncbi:MAG: TlpA disulfide reductase family protein [Candidatus Manganitrophus sp.]|nr:MAG: TlpA disulfide reductase family protein [Candidatus Manganitrophus sp.]
MQEGSRILGLLCLLSSPAWPASIGDAAPGFSLPAPQEGKVSLEEFKGKVVLINFWASWCTPCQEELPELQKIYQKYQERGFEVIGINIDKKQVNAEKLIQRFNLTFPVGLDPESSTIREYKGRSMPMSYLIDRQGAIRELFFGFNRKKLAGMEKSIVEALDEAAK